jgi:hypothetical protein
MTMIIIYGNRQGRRKESGGREGVSEGRIRISLVENGGSGVDK